MSQDLFNQADLLEVQGHLDRALTLWRQIAASNPTRNVFLRLGRCAEELGLLPDAQHAFTCALEIDGRSTKALVALGLLAIHQHNYAAAVDYLSRASALKEHPAILSVLGLALRHTGHDQESESAYRHALRLDPHYDEAHYNLGVLLRLTHRHTEAEVHLRIALELDPLFAPTHREFGFLLLEHGTDPEDTEAGHHLRQAVALDPTDSWAHIYLGAYLSDFDTVAAAAEFHHAASLQPAWSFPLSRLGALYESTDSALAQSYFDQALTLDPDDEDALLELSRIFEQRGQPDLAQHYATRALEQESSPGAGSAESSSA